jgi:flagellin
MTVLNTNISAQLTSNAMSQNQRAMAQAMERLSTGTRINSASDDAAGLAIVSKMDSQVTGLNTAVKNANDAISMIQTADGATIEIDSMLQRMRELSAQAGNGTNTASDLTVLNKEFANLATEIDRIANTTQFNNTNILDGTGGTSGVFSFQVGANASETLSVDFEDFNLAAGSTAATVGVQTLTMSQAQLRTGSATSDDYVIQFSNGTSMTMDVAEIAATTGVTDATDDTLAGFAAVFNTKNAAATASGGVPDITAAVSGTNITFTQATAGTGTISGVFRMPTATGIVAAITGTLTQTTNGAAAGDGDPMAENLSAWATAGSVAQTSTTLTKIDAAIAGVATQRAEFGSWINRLEHIVDNLSNVSQNTTAARSRIEDADYAAESSELARTQIISQAATAMLSQANQQAQSVLALLR